MPITCLLYLLHSLSFQRGHLLISKSTREDQEDPHNFLLPLSFPYQTQRSYRISQLSKACEQQLSSSCLPMNLKLSTLNSNFTCTCSSFVVSKAEVASSKSRILGLLTIALAIATRCFCPPERKDPLSPTFLWNPGDSCMFPALLVILISSSERYYCGTSGCEAFGSNPKFPLLMKSKAFACIAAA